MSIRIPPKADIETQNAFKDVELRLRDLEAKAGNGKIRGEELREMQTLKAEVEGLRRDPDHNEELRETTFVGPVNFLGTARFPTQPELGFIDLVPDGIGSEAQKTHNLHGSLAICPGGLSADSVLCRLLMAHGDATLGGDASVTGNITAAGYVTAVPRAAARFNFSTYTTSGSTYILRWSITDFNVDSTQIYTASGDNYEKVYVASAGYYRIGTIALCNHSASSRANFNLIRYNSSDVAQDTFRFQTEGSTYESALHSVNFSCSAGDYFTVDFTRVTGTGVPYTADQTHSYFSIERIN